MKIAFITHFYPPSPCGGAGKYTAAIATLFQRHGATVAVLCADQWGEGVAHINGHVDDEYDGVPVRRILINWRKAPRPFDYLYDNPALDADVGRFLSEFKPDVVHVTSCYALSARVIALAKARRIPVVVHLVDFWFICPLHTLLRRNGELCDGGRDAWDCQSCLLTGTKYAIVTAKMLTESQRANLTRRLVGSSLATRTRGLIGLFGDMERRRALVPEYLEQADILIAPSYALRDLYVKNGIPAQRMHVMHYGHDFSWASQVQRKPDSRLRLVYIGNILPIKGVHVLLNAFSRLQPDSGIVLDIYGVDDLDISYSTGLRSALPDNIRWHGAYRPADLPVILGNADIVVVPSLWHENNPLVIQEAFAAQIPVIATDLGGMAEFVQHEINGLLFKPGNADDLAFQIHRIVADPILLDRLRSGIPPVRTIDQEVDDLVAIYNQLIGTWHG